MTLAAHLVELRRRLVMSAVAMLVGVVAGYVLSDAIWAGLRSPIEEIAGHHRAASINYTGITEAFDLKLQIAMAAGVVISAPVWLFQLWRFIVPGLTRVERRYSVGFGLTAIPLFFAGCLTGWIIWPHVVQLMVGFASGQETVFLSARNYLEFVLKLVLVVGVAFVMPVFIVLLNFVGVLSAGAILRGWRAAILGITLFTAMATPAADLVSMFLLAVPMAMLYLGAAAVAWEHDRRHARRLSRLLDEPASSDRRLALAGVGESPATRETDSPRPGPGSSERR
jgi:sec-independent protein translocase protein TatC